MQDRNKEEDEESKDSNLTGRKANLHFKKCFIEFDHTENRYPLKNRTFLEKK